MKTKDLRASKIDVKAELDQLFALDVRVAKATPALLPLETKEKLSDFLIKEHSSETWVWRDQSGKMAGYLSLIDKPKERSMEILNICVDPDLQGRGYGREMMAFAEKMAVDRGREKATLVTNNLPFGTHLGFVV